MNQTNDVNRLKSINSRVTKSECLHFHSSLVPYPPLLLLKGGYPPLLLLKGAILVNGPAFNS